MGSENGRYEGTLMSPYLSSYKQSVWHDYVKRNATEI